MAAKPMSVATGPAPRLDENQEPRFLEQVKLFYDHAVKQTGIDPMYLEMIKAC